MDSFNPYQIRSNLLMSATDYIGACNPKQAALVWAEGVKLRNAAMQYAVMTNSLKATYAQQLESTTYQGNWVTGVSSPWIDSYKILRMYESALSEMQFALTFSTATSSGYAGSYNAALTINAEDSFWRISYIQLDKELYTYTGFQL